MPIKYTFYVEHSNGTQITWTGLTLKRARDMHAYTNAHQPCDVTRHGWYEERMARSLAMLDEIKPPVDAEMQKAISKLILERNL